MFRTGPTERSARTSAAAPSVHAVERQDGTVNASRRGHHRVPHVTCSECGLQSGPLWRRWRAYRSDDPELGGPPGLAFYCQPCAKREFGK